MNSRERLMAILKKEAFVDRIPWSPLIDGYFLSSYPAGTDILEVFQDIGADVMERHVRTWQSSFSRRGQELLLSSEEDGCVNFEESGVRISLCVERHEKGRLLRRSYSIPGRTLTSTFLYTKVSPFIPFPMERLIKNVEDLEAYEYIKKRETYVPAYTSYVDEDKRIGEAGIATDSGTATPIQELLQVLIGVEHFYMEFYADYLEKLESLMETMHRKNMEAYEIMARSPADVVIEYENTSTTLTSPEIYRKYSLPYINEYADILHEKKKIFLTHRCGTLKGLLHLLKEGKEDGLADISPPPTGDLSIAEAQQALPDMIIMGGLDPTFLAQWPPEKIREHVRGMLRGARTKQNLILGSADAVPKDARVENLKAVGEIIEETA